MDVVRFSPLNFGVLFVYFAAMVAVGLKLAGRQRSTEDYFLAGRRMPWLAVAMSMFASLTSAVTYMGLPALAYKENVSLIVVCLVSPLLAPILVRVFYPLYQRLRVTTSYEYVGLRFGRGARFATSGLFILARLGWLGTVIYAPALALSVVTGMPLVSAILLMGLVATVYTTLGGISADIWTDVAQFVLMIGGAIWIAVTLVQQVPDGAAGILRLAHDTNRLNVFHWRGFFEMSAGIVAVSFFFQMMQDYGTDQTTVQRLMTIPTLRGTTKAILFNAVTDFFMIGLLLFIGLGLFAFHTAHADLLPAGIGGDRLLPYYILHALPDGISGLLIAAIFAAAMSSMDSGINSLSTAILNDFVTPLRRTPRTQAQDLRLARSLTLVFGAFGTGVAFFVSRFEHIIEAYTTMISLFNGPILALFLLGLLMPRGRFAGWVAGALVSIPATLWLQYDIQAHWTVFFPFSFGVAMLVSVVVSLLLPTRSADPALTVWTR